MCVRAHTKRETHTDRQTDRERERDGNIPKSRRREGKERGRDKSGARVLAQTLSFEFVAPYLYVGRSDLPFAVSISVLILLFVCLLLTGSRWSCSRVLTTVRFVSSLAIALCAAQVWISGALLSLLRYLAGLADSFRVARPPSLSCSRDLRSCSRGTLIGRKPEISLGFSICAASAVEMVCPDLFASLCLLFVCPVCQTWKPHARSSNASVETPPRCKGWEPHRESCVETPPLDPPPNQAWKPHRLIRHQAWKPHRSAIKRGSPTA